VLGIGRGDSSLAHLGLAPASVAHLARYVQVLRSYLHGEAVDYDALAPFAPQGGHRSVDGLGLAAVPDGSRLGWLRGSLPPVPVEVVGTGPAVLGVGGKYADRAMVAVGADPDRVKWAIEVVRAARAESGIAAPIAIGAFVNVVAHPDVDVARSLVAGGVASVARFSVMHGTVSVPATDSQREVLAGVHRSYDMTAHTRTGASHTAALTAEFIDQFSIAGPAGHCIDRLTELTALGVDRFVVMGPTAGGDRDQQRVASRYLVDDVLPAIRTLNG
jgi:5,10-methylenetetrahydromethanopterin reductase